MCSYPQPTNNASGTKSGITNSGFEHLASRLGGRFLLKTQECLTVGFMGVSGSLPLTQPSLSPLLITVLIVKGSSGNYFASSRFNICDLGW